MFYRKVARLVDWVVLGLFGCMVNLLSQTALFFHPFMPSASSTHDRCLFQLFLSLEKFFPNPRYFFDVQNFIILLKFFSTRVMSTPRLSFCLST